VHPQREDYLGNVDSTGPRAVYDEAKRYGEAIVSAYRRSFGVQTRIARIFNTYGPRMRLDDGRVVPAFVSQALAGQDFTVFGDGTQTRSFCYVRDLVDGLVRLARSEVQDPVNLGNPVEMTILQFAEAVRQAAGGGGRIVHQPLPQGDPRQRQPDITRARTLLQWEPRVPLAEGLRETIGWFREHLSAGR
jgi:dTDP-glucose 4,6-dehydratase